jgi:hypothetical protein
MAERLIRGCDEELRSARSDGWVRLGQRWAHARSDLVNESGASCTRSATDIVGAIRMRSATAPPGTSGRLFGHL